MVLKEISKIFQNESINFNDLSALKLFTDYNSQS